MNLKKISWVVRALIYSLAGNIKPLSYIGKPIFITNISKLKLAKKTRIYPGARLELLGKHGILAVGENTSIGQNFHAVAYDDVLKIGTNVTISGNVFITNCEHGYNEIGVHILEQPVNKQHTEIGDNCFIGYGAVLMAGTKLGKQCIVGANSVVKGTFEDCSVIVGTPAKVVRKYNKDTKEWEKQ